jgi:hypothetical protein
VPRTPDAQTPSASQPPASSRRDDGQDTSIAAITPLGWGSTTLVAGAKAVALPAITAGSTVVYSVKTIAGTTGLLSLVITPSVGFTVTSLSALDTSTFSYVVMP